MLLPCSTACPPPYVVKAMRTALLLVVAALWWGTDGLQALTSETARRLDIAAAPRLLPDVLLRDQAGRPFRLTDYRGAPLVLEFIYTTCPDICLSLGTAAALRWKCPALNQFLIYQHLPQFSRQSSAETGQVAGQIPLAGNPEQHGTDSIVC